MFLRRMTSLAQCQIEVLLRFTPIARRQMLLPRHPILMTLPMPFLNVGLNPDSKADTKAEYSRGAEHDYTVRSAGPSPYFSTDRTATVRESVVFVGPSRDRQGVGCWVL